MSLLNPPVVFGGLWKHDLDSAGDRPRQTHDVPHLAAGGDSTLAPLDRAVAIGVDYKQMYKWRKGVEPSGGAMHALYQFAGRIPGGLHILMGDGFQMTYFKN